MTTTASAYPRVLLSLGLLAAGAIAISYNDAIGGGLTKALAFIPVVVISLISLRVLLARTEEDRALSRAVSACAVAWGCAWAALGALALSLESGWGAGQVLPLSGLLAGTLCGATFAAFAHRSLAGRPGFGAALLSGIASAVTVTGLLSLPTVLVQHASVREWAGIAGTMLVLFVPLASVSGAMSRRMVSRRGEVRMG